MLNWKHVKSNILSFFFLSPSIAADERATADGQSSLRFGCRSFGGGRWPRGAATGQCNSFTETNTSKDDTHNTCFLNTFDEGNTQHSLWGQSAYGHICAWTQIVCWHFLPRLVCDCVGAWTHSRTLTEADALHTLVAFQCCALRTTENSLLWVELNWLVINRSVRGS